MTRIGNTVMACSTALAVSVAGTSIAAERAHESAVSGGTRMPAVSSEPSSWTEYERLIRDGGSVTGGPLMTSKSAAPLTPGARNLVTGKDGKGGSSSLAASCERTPLLCGVYGSGDAGLFETDHGPFARALGNFEDFELTNATPNSLCIAAPLPLNCNAAADPSGFFCAGNAVDAGDILKGLSIDNTPKQGFAWEMIVTGAGFRGHSNKYVTPNYFSDSTLLKFPNAAAPVGCQKASPGPDTLGMLLVSPNGAPNSQYVVTLTDGRSMDVVTGAIDQKGVFIGLCCPGEIESFEVWQPDHGGTIGVDEVRWGTHVAACPVSFPPITLDDINCALEVIEAKLDAGVGGGGGCAPICLDEIEALVDKNAANGLESKADSACRAKTRGQLHTARNTMCAFLSHVDSLEGGSITAAEATALRACASSDSGLDLSDCGN